MKVIAMAENFRSSQVICSFASSLRRSPAEDRAVGRYAAERVPILLLPYEGDGGSEVGKTFSTELSRLGLSQLGSMVLAHRLATALRATGRPEPPPRGASGPSRLANAVVRFRESVLDPRGLLSSVRAVERMLLSRLGIKAGEMTPDHAAEEGGIDFRWLRTEALRLLGDLARAPLVDTPGQRWIEVARRVVGAARPPTGKAFLRSAQQVLPETTGFVLPMPTSHGVHGLLSAATVHSVKGREFDAVLLVLPRDKRTAEVIQAWEERADDEARAVLYVAATRARRLLALAMPSELLGRLQTLAARDGAMCEIVPVTNPSPVQGDPPALSGRGNGPP